MREIPPIGPPARSPPLAGRRVLDLSRVLAGPWCAMILADLGAEVIKVENPKGGDDSRHWGPPDIGGESAYYLCANRNKKSIAIDLATLQGQELVRALAACSDVVVENYKLGTLERFGLDYAALAALTRPSSTARSPVTVAPRRLPPVRAMISSSRPRAG